MGRPEGAAGAAASKPMKLRASQRQQRAMSLGWWDIAGFISDEFRDHFDGHDLRFTASEAEAYDVAGVCAHEADAAKLLSKGIRTGDAAREYLEARGLAHLIEDRPTLMREALDKGVRFEDFVRSFSVLRAARPVEDRIGALRFAASSFGDNPRTQSVLDRVLGGAIAFDDIKTVGIGRLKDQFKIVNFAPLLEKAHAGYEGYGIESIRAFAIRLETDESVGARFPNVVAFADLVGPEATLELPSLRAASDAFNALNLRNEARQPGAAEKALYFARFFAAAGDDRHTAHGYFEAGVPVETAIAVHANGGTPEQAAAVHRGEVAAPMAGGYL